MDLSIAGIGIVSPWGMTAQDHAFFLRADATSPPPSPFVTADDERIDVMYCPWIGARLSLVQRLVLMGQMALQEALETWQAAVGDAAEAVLFLCTAAPRAGLSEEALELLTATVRATPRLSRVVPLRGAAAAFGALSQANDVVARGQAAVVLGVDSFISVESLTARLEKPPHDWSDAVKEHGEAAAAVLLLPHARARSLGMAIAQIHGAQIAASNSNDDNDEVVDGVAMSQVLRTLPNPGPIAMAFGQERVDPLRRNAWHLATARNAQRFAAEQHFETLERELGRVGAAAGVLNLAYAAARLRHSALEPGFSPAQPFVAWAVSRDGTRGAAIGTGEGT